MFPLPPAFNTYTMLLCSVTLIGVVPCEDTVEINCKLSGEILNEETELLPALTASSHSLLRDRITASWLPSPAPVPFSPIEYAFRNVRCPEASLL